MKIDILMATYNGSNYIEEQLNSLINQTYQDWILYIHDDGSTDNTVAIINTFVINDNRIKLINDGIRCGGAAQNFLHLLNFSTSGYIIFCDQDDIWLEDKLSVLFNLINTEEGICAVYCNAFAYDGNKIIKQKVHLFYNSNLKNSLFLNSGVQGCSLMFNKKLLDIVRGYPEYVCMHDHLITIAAVTFGKLKYLDKSLMLYRQHSSNVTGNVPTSFFQRLYLFFKSSNAVIDLNHFKANKSFYLFYKNEINSNNKQLFEAYLRFPYVNLLTRLLIILSNSFTIGYNPIILLIKTLIRKPIK